jgi:hypothetical protein
VQAELGEPRTWGFVCELARELLPPDVQPPAQPMRWHHFKYVKNNQVLLTELGTVLVNRIRARRNPKVKGRSIGKREVDQGLVERKVIKRLDGSDEVLEIHQVDGELGLRELTETGEFHFVPLQPTKLFMNPNRADGSAPFRPYIGLKLPPEVALRTGKREITVAIYQTK